MSTTADSDTVECPTFEVTAMVHAAYNWKPSKKTKFERNNNKVRQTIEIQTFDEITTVKEIPMEFVPLRKQTGRVMQAFRKNQEQSHNEIKYVSESDTSGQVMQAFRKNQEQSHNEIKYVSESDTSECEVTNTEVYFNNLFDTLKPRSKCNYNLRRQTKKENLFYDASNSDTPYSRTKRRRRKQDASKAKKRKHGRNKRFISPDVIRQDDNASEIEVWPDLYIEKESKRRKSDSLILSPDELSDDIPLAVVPQLLSPSGEFTVETASPLLTDVLQRSPPLNLIHGKLSSPIDSMMEVHRNLEASNRWVNKLQSFQASSELEEELPIFSSTAIKQQELPTLLSNENEQLPKFSTVNEEELSKLSIIKEKESSIPRDVTVAPKSVDILQNITIRRAESIEETDIADQICASIIDYLKVKIPLLSTLNTSEEFQRKIEVLNEVVKTL